ncbi:tRNA preQ1(34) S-adenosylmethionine ribosyltransferase-isomerase QueA [Helicobacter trogontum]|uniref:tRNA preQ1(34) S-adenosylmethionine ribosyltransferase-isomerase QueA n=1 Tax=Helicobacter trogontum TaxID=50960 RepID=A0A4U8SDJ3_9HELI|nr:tRNA preQ1(34) S-adenosylmethionine ribosyltransferase-isomerase QueA [Helicobacter trogontum]TLD84131.1 tRNA preQ1(34) S-adenosylmethionine ribosyltransferase-isomerase QueA [Helicobacter trogontum]
MCDDLDLLGYDFVLPNNLIATTPITPKENARLLIYHDGKITHTTFHKLFDYIPQDYLIVLNDTKVINARLFVNKLSLESLHKTRPHEMQTLQDYILPTKREIFYHKWLSNNLHLVQIKGKAKLYDIFVLRWNNIDIFIQVLDIKNDGYKLVSFFTLHDIAAVREIALCKSHTDIFSHVDVLSQSQVLSVLQACGNIPLPPYMKRTSTEKDSKDYQSIFARHDGSVAAPTASLHFSESMFKVLKEKYDHAFVTLHVGAGTFKPVTSQNILNHKIHSESCLIKEQEVKKILNAKKLLCVGTTSMRSVEWLIREDLTQLNGDIMGENTIFLHPLNPPKKVHALLTNFHLPKSSLLMLVSSMIGRKETLRIYQEAIENKYRFYSYGDGMLII